jgi:hypothetical protein
MYGYLFRMSDFFSDSGTLSGNKAGNKKVAVDRNDPYGR